MYPGGALHLCTPGWALHAPSMKLAMDGSVWFAILAAGYWSRGLDPRWPALARPGAFPRKRVVATPFGPPDDGRGRSRRHRGKRAHWTFPIGDRLVWGEAVPSEACLLYSVPLVPSRGIPTHRQDAVQRRVGLVRAGATVGLGA